MSQADKETLLCMANAFGKDESWLTNGKGYDSDVSEWYGIYVEDGRVLGIDWREQGLTGSIPKKMGNLTELQCLCLFDNSLSGDIPIELCKLTNLHILYLTGNNLSCEMPMILNNEYKVIPFFERLRKEVSHTLLQ